MDVKSFLEQLPSKVDPELVEGMSTLFHFDIEGAGQYSIELDNGELKVHQGLQGEPKCKVTSNADTLSKIVSGSQNPMMAMMTGKLKISNPGELLKYAKIFGLG